MADARRYLGQALLYALFFVPLAYVTHLPRHTHLEQDMAVLKVAVRHAGKTVGECRPIEGAEYDNLPSNMKRQEVCPRERSPLRLELILDGESLYRASVSASGLHSDGVSSMYRRFTIPAGKHHLRLLMNDDVAIEGHTWQLEQDIELQPAQVMVASFKEGFRIQ
ncbi:MAG: hypothetical protein OEV47_12080 [Gammaproteobacteria bacterium]|nr:hypothetical protein [Gammaproteobacteria bacterium]